uniref:Zinc finger CCHC domain-containing protein 8 n=1 Tax=Takifugu rubripes TaxID=31033 RepID=H2T5U0_TAKRU
MAEVDFGDSELFEQLGDSPPPVSQHIRFTDDEDDCDEIRQLRSRLEECEDCNQRLIEENILTVGSHYVSYFTTFCLDKLGQPLLNENPQTTDGWDTPLYSVCFNCGLSGHQLRDCPKPKNMAAINERRKEFNQNNNQVTLGNQRYHADEVEERFSKYRPGIISDELLSALGIDGHTIPPLIYRMRRLGYPPGWLKEAEMENSGLTLYDGNVSNDGNITDHTSSQNISYDVSKLVDFPGFNVPAPRGMRDYGSIPMQNSHMKQNFSAYLSNNFPEVIILKTQVVGLFLSTNKAHISPYANNFQFQPPLPPGSPCFSSPPPLPQGTPPATPTPPPLPKETPPVTPRNGSPALRGQNWKVVDEIEEKTEDELTLEELEEQQRMIWAALENADTTPSSDCETPVSPCVSTPVHVDTEMEDTEEVPVPTEPVEPCHKNTAEEQPDSQEDEDVRKVKAVPHRSYFATGIVPFEDTPEYTEVAEATGTYLKIRDLLKSSPRSLGKKK